MVVTISNLYGSGGVAVAELVAHQLGYEYVDEQLPVVVAKRLRTTPQAVESSEDAGESAGERMLRALESGTPEIRAQSGPDFDAEVLREVQECVREYAAHGDVVIVGRGAHAVLGRRRDVLRVFVYAPRAWRIAHVVDGLGVDEAIAAAEVDRIDRARANYMKTHYDLRWSDAQNYDLCLDASHFGAEASAAVIAAAVRAK
jgi:cytidylate kinase